MEVEMEQQVRIHIPGTAMSVGFTNDEFVASQIAPAIRVPKNKFDYYEFTKTRFDIPYLERAPRSDFKRFDIGVSLKNGACTQRGGEELIDDSERRDYENDIDLEMEKSEDVTDRTLLSTEKRVADILRSTTNLTQNVTLAGTSQFNDYSNSDPVSVFKTARTTIHKAVAKKARIAVMGFEVFETLREHTKIKDHFKYTSSQSLTADMLARFFELDQIVVGGALYNTAKEGQTPVLDYVWGKDIIVAYVAPRPARYRPSLMYTFWTPVKGQRRVIEMYREEKKTSDVIRVHEETDEHLVHGKCGYLIKNAIA
jgi:hypothetical protein